MSRRERAVLVGIFALVAMALRLGFVLYSEVDQPIRADAAQYVTCAKNLVEHGILSTETGDLPRPDSFRSPGYPAFLAVLMLCFGKTGYYVPALVLQALLSALLVLVVYRLARTFLAFGPALLAAVLTALSPHLVASCGYVLTESLTANLLAMVCLSLAAWQRRATTRRAFYVGLACGLLYLLQEAVLPLLVVLIVWLGRKSMLRRTALVALGTYLLVVGSWQVRCATTVPAGAATAGDRVLATLSHGTYPALYHLTEENRYYPYREDVEQPEFGRSWSKFTAVLGARVSERPLRYVAWYCLEKPAWLWSWGIVQGQGDVLVYPVRRSFFAGFPVADAIRAGMRWLHPFCLLALLVGLASRRLPAWIVLPMLWFTILHSVFLPDPRYLVPLKPICFAAVAAGTTSVIAAVAAWRGRDKAGPAQLPGPSDPVTTRAAHSADAGCR